MPALLATRLRDYISLMRLDKPIGIFLLLWPTLWALLVASDGRPDLDIVMIFTLGVIVMRSAGCVINDYADRDIDRHVSRTQNRPLTAGRLSTADAKRLFLLLCVAGLYLVLQLNRLTLLLSVVTRSVPTKEVSMEPTTSFRATFSSSSRSRRSFAWVPRRARMIS